MTSSPRNPHAGIPFGDDDETIARMLEDVSIPTLMCSLVHMTGDPSWIRGDIRPAGLFLNEYQGFMDEEMKAEARRRALPAIAAFRDGGCELPPEPSPDLVHEMMNYLACAEVSDEILPMMLEEMELDGRDAGAVEWGDEVPAEVRADSPVVVIGCGESGVLAGIRLAEAGLPFTIVEKNGGPGGTWWDNTYPGARVDVGSHFYCYSFEPSDHWTEYFSQQPELQQYFQNVLEKYDLGPNCRFDTEVTSATWNADTGRWSVEVRSSDGTPDTIEARAVISAVGSLNIPLLPDIDGIDDFAGPSFHSARWDHSVDLRGSRVAMIGAGASGFQIAPTIAPETEHLTIFQRTAQWMFPNPNYHEPVGEGQKWAIRHLPFFGRWFRFLIFFPASGSDLSGSRVDPDFDDSDGLAISERNLATRQFFLGWMKEQIGDDEELLAKITPDYPATGKRTLQDNGSWLGCLTRDDVDLVRTPIERIEADGVRTVDGVLHPADVIVHATGFQHNRYLYPMTITGAEGTVLNEVWGDRPTAYLGITVPDFPNFFLMYGPGTNLASGGSLIFHSECQISYIMGCLHELLAGGHTAMAVKPAVDADFQARLRAEIDQMVWSHWAVTHSHYKNADGSIYTLSPWPLQRYREWTKAPDPTEYEFT